MHSVEGYTWQGRRDAQLNYLYARPEQSRTERGGKVGLGGLLLCILREKGRIETAEKVDR